MPELGRPAPGLTKPYELRQSRVLAWATLASAAMMVFWGIVLPQWIVSSSPFDPMLAVAVVGVPWFLTLWALNRRGRFHIAAQGFVVATFVLAWAFTVLIQGSGYFVGNYSYLAYTVIVASVFLKPGGTLLVAGLNLIGIFALGTYTELAGSDLILSYANLSIFSLLLVVTASLRERDERKLDEQASNMQMILDENRVLMDSTEDALVSLDEHLRVRAWNPAAADIMADLGGQQPVAGADWLELLPDAERDAMAGRLSRARYGGERVRFKRSMGDKVLEFVLYPVREQKGVVVNIHDITALEAAMMEEHKVDLEERDAQHREDLHRFKARVLDAASHELNTPLTPIRMQLDLLRGGRKGPLNENQIRSIALVERNLKRLESIVADLLEVARAEEGGIRVEKERMELDSAVADMVEIYQPVAEKAGVRLVCEAPESVWVYADPRRVEQAIQHILSNAIKFTPEGGEVMVRVRDHDGQGRVEVADTGRGFDPERRDELFEPFGHLHDVDDGHVGAGLGLFLARNVVEAHGGRIGAESEGSGRGSTFWFEVPRRPNLSEGN